jgi:ATP-dependent Clp protease adaptor protein ClpS
MEQYFHEEESDLLVVEKEVQSRSLLVYNDDVNTFEWVIETLVDICDHSWEQAEQCSLLIHHKGKCSVRHGSYDELRPMKEAICDRGISATIN